MATYDEHERSGYDGNPIQYYEFLCGEMQWNYVASERAHNVAGIDYQPLNLKDGGIVISGDSAQDALTITAPSNLPLADLYRGTPPTEEVWVRIKRLDWGADEMVTVYVGTVAEVDVPTPGTMEITCATLDTKFRGTGLRLTWTRGCPYIVYDTDTCKAAKAGFSLRATINFTDGGRINASQFGLFPDGWFSGGFIEWKRNGLTQRRAIEQHLGNDCTLLGFSDGIEAGMEVTAFAGCDRTSETCNNKFNNLINYGGVFFMPGKSPFDGDPVF